MKNQILKLVAVVSMITFICLGTSCEKESNCITCTLDNETSEVCESDIAEFNRESGLNATSLDEVRTVVQLVGGSCR